MASNARFHNKWHRRNHHSQPSPGYPDSASDPIASREEPFLGDFVISGNLSASKNLFVDQDATIQGSLSVLGNITYLDTLVTVTSALSVINSGTGPALTVVQNGQQPIARFIDGDAAGGQRYAMFIDNDGYVTINGDIAYQKFDPLFNQPRSLQLAVSGNILAGGNVQWERRKENCIYVSTSGSDTNSGLNPSVPVRTIKKAVKVAFDIYGPNKSTIFVETGDYSELNPIYLPPGTSLIGDNLRRTTIRPKNKQYDILWCNNACYVWGFTFRDHLEPSAACAFPILNTSDPQYTVAFNTPGYVIDTTRTGPPFGLPIVSKPFITTSPYIQGCSSITTGVGGVSAGCGIRVDGNLASGYLRSFVTDSFTQFNQGGKGLHIINNGYAQLVSTFTICCTEGVICESGGTCSISTSNCSFGLSGLVARGKSWYPVLTGTQISTTPLGENYLDVQFVNPRPFNINQITNPSLTAIPVVEPYPGLIIKIQDDPASRVDPILNPTGRTFYHNIRSVSAIDLNIYKYRITLNSNVAAPLTAAIAEPKYVEFYLRSQIASSSHAFEYIGTGTVLEQAVPALGGKPNNDIEAVFSDDGIVYYTSTNEDGDFKVGNGFTIVQSLGRIRGRSFDRSILALVTPLVLALE